MEDLVGLGLLAGSGRLWPALAGIQILWSIRTQLFDLPEALRTRYFNSTFPHSVLGLSLEAASVSCGVPVFPFLSFF